MIVQNDNSDTILEPIFNNDQYQQCYLLIKYKKRLIDGSIIEKGWIDFDIFAQIKKLISDFGVGFLPNIFFFY
jgi:hypothetical protein